MSRAFNGTTASFNTTIARVESISVTADNETTDVTTVDDAYQVFESGKKISAATVTTLGAAGYSEGETGTLAFVWNSGDSQSLVNMLCKSANKEGSLGAPEKNTYAFVKTPA